LETQRLLVKRASKKYIVKWRIERKNNYEALPLEALEIQTSL